MNVCLFWLASLSIVFADTSETLGCDPDTGQAFLSTPYKSKNKYRYRTCRSDAHVGQKSKGKNQHPDKTPAYCYYQSLINKHGRYSGSDYQTDTSRPVSRASLILPAECYSPDGMDCGWYRQCLAEMFPCTQEAEYEYAISYGEKFCDLYEESKSKFSENAMRWLDAARKCLQVGVAN